MTEGNHQSVLLQFAAAGAFVEGARLMHMLLCCLQSDEGCPSLCTPVRITQEQSASEAVPISMRCVPQLHCCPPGSFVTRAWGAMHDLADYLPAGDLRAAFQTPRASSMPPPSLRAVSAL